MTHPPMVTPPDPPDAQSSTPAVSTRRGALQSGFSLLARGEPQIWFTGGMLVICIAMIVGLLVLILVSGLPTFWPKPLDVVVLNDGELLIGQPQKTRREDIKVSLSELANPGSAAGGLEATDVGAQYDALDAAVEPTPASSDPRSETSQQRRGTSRYYRTGNYDLTGEHYRWLDAGESLDAGVLQPQTAMVIERLENGRLYGLPLEFVHEIRPASDVAVELDELDALLEFVELIASSDAGEASEQTLVVLRQAREQRLDAGLRQRLLAETPSEAEVRLDHRPTADGGILQFRTDSDNWQTLGPREDATASATDLPQDSLTAARQIWIAPDAMIRRVISAANRATELRGQADQVKYRISRLDERVSKLRSNVRRAEIEVGQRAVQPVDQSHFLLDQQVRLRLRSEQLDEMRQRLDDLLANLSSDDDAPVVESLREASLEWLERYERETLPDELSTIDQQLDDWLEAFDAQPGVLRQAIVEYQEGFREVVRAKVPLQEALEDVNRQLELSSTTFAVPSLSSELEGVSPEDLEALQGEVVTASLAEVLKSFIGQEVVPDSLTSLVTGRHLQLLTVRDSQSHAHVLAISDPGYVGRSLAEGGEATSPEDLKVNRSRRLALLQSTEVPAEQMVRAIAVNRLTVGQKFHVYLDRWREFLLENPREANTEGGVFPAIWGTIVMTMIMIVVVVPFGVMAALYLREYAGSGPLVSLIRISINNLAGVPSIVYGVFGLSFFCYTVGSYIDGGPKNADIIPWPPATWFVALAIVAGTGTTAFFCSFLSGGPVHSQTRVKKWLSRGGLILWLVSVALVGILILKSPFFEGFYREHLPNPTFGKGGLMWAAMTLALLTLPVVIVATEEALSAVPNSLREGSLACGASKWQTILRIILPHARPGILTGAILAMARGAGEVAPLMLVGALPTAPDLPLDTEYPYLHGSRSFMHLGYQIYTLGFQSQNSEAARPMVFTCTLLLILMVGLLNITAIYLRATLKKRFEGSQF
jgi:ABC-type phosphate transport system permease subunit/ABC-type phosphate transport system auxiliary subunit